MMVVVVGFSQKKRSEAVLSPQPQLVRTDT